VVDLFSSHGNLLTSWLPEPLLQELRQPSPSADTLAAARARIVAACARVAPFAPSVVLSQLDEPNGNRRRIAGQYITGTILTAEVAGLAALSSRMAEDGRAGAEAASAVVSQLLGTLFRTIHDHGGGVIKAGGETLTAFFDARKLGEAHALYAATAALALQERATTAGTGSPPLRLRVAAHVGRVLAVEVGDTGHAELLVTGHAISRVARALLGAAPGEVIVTDKLLGHIPAADAPLKVSGQHVLRALAEPAPRPSFAIDHSPPPDATLPELLERLAALQPYAPRGIPGRLASMTLGSGEFRPVTVMMANFCAFNRLLDLLELPALIESDPTIIGHVLNTYYTRIQAVIQRYGGVVNRIDLAPYGDRFVALFGAPTAHEDDPARAVQTALTVRAELSETNQAITGLLRDWAAEHPDQQRLVYLMSITMRQRVGIAGGDVFAGIVGAAERHEYTVLGQPVHLAARLLAGAEDGETLLSDDTCRAVRHLVAVEARPPVLIDAGTRPSPVFRAVQQRYESDEPARQLWRSAPLIGRDAELSQALDTACAALEPGDAAGRVLALVGPPGVGKTRLADEMLRVLRGRLPAAALVHEVCQSYDQAVPYSALARLVRRMVYVPVSPDRAAQARAVEEQVLELVPGWARFIALLGPLLGLQFEETDATRALGSDERRERLHELLVALCHALARRHPLVLVVDDAQWADASTRAALLRVADEIPGHQILLLVLQRPDAALEQGWQTLPHATCIALGDLLRDESEALLAALLDGRLPDELHPLVERAHGTPLFIEETVRFLLDTGVLMRDSAGEWFCTRSVQRTVVPAQIEQIIVSRLDQLGAVEREALDIAAVLGRRFSERLLGDVLRQGTAPLALSAGLNGHGAPNPPRGGLGALEALVRAEILAPDERALEATYTFRHALIRDVTYGTILFARRHELHARVAEAIERLYAENLDEQRVLLAQHELHAGRSERALPHLIQAARNAQARYANSEALALYRQALAIAPQHDQTTERLDAQTAALYENLAEILVLTGDYPAARSNYEWLLRVGIAEEPGARVTRKAALQRKVGATHEQEGNLELALNWFERAADTIAHQPAHYSRESDADLEHARILSDIGWIHFRHDRLQQAQNQFEHALALLEPHQRRPELARLLNRLGGIAWARGDIDLAFHYVERSRAASECSGDLVGQANALNNLGVLSAGQGHSAEAVRHGLRAMELYERVGNRRMSAVTAINVGHAYYDMEEYQQALGSFQSALAGSLAVRDVYHQMVAHLGLGLAQLAAGYVDAAGQALEHSRQLALELNLPAEELDACTALGELAILRGDHWRALEYCRAGRALEVDPETAEAGRLQRLEARLLAHQGAREQAAELLNEATELFTRLHNVPEARRTQTLLAELLPAVL
jgi:class 3 adenylate cyclase/tetratricopeptide (TPR) repeat protein